MEKDAYYFPHFSNARLDPKILRLRKELGLEGYAIYFLLLETLRDQPGLKYSMENVDLLADEFGTSEQKLRTVIANYKLFQIDENNCFYSEKFEEYLEPYFRMKEQRREAGIKSGEVRKKKVLNNRSTNIKRVLNENEQSKVNQSKVNQSKVKEISKAENTGQPTQLLITETKKVMEERFVRPRDIDETVNMFVALWMEKNPPGSIEYEKMVPTGKLADEAEKFFNHYSANGWKQSNGLVLKDYFATARNWFGNMEKFQSNSTWGKK